MGIARRKTVFDSARWFSVASGLKRFLTAIPGLQDARGFRLVSYLVVVAAAVVPALVWNSLSAPGGAGSEPSLPVYGPFVLVGGILVLEAALILWVKMLQFGNERVRRRRERRTAANPPAGEITVDPWQQDRDQASGAPVIPRVLVVDDDPINRMILRKQLMRLNIEPVSAADGMEALGTVQEGHWDMILMDGQMPRLDGPETAHEIRLRELLPPDVPIIGISTNDTPEFRERCLKAGMQACYHKPIRRFVLEKLVDVYVRRRVAESPDHIVGRALSSEPARF
ncbi:response regulator [Marinobacter sp.]|uniref:response regulator n=1 Tax=Marinobacter sp. TaxID=50741 RepID=UPI003566CE81